MTTSSPQPLVSVITPVYNGERYLGKCIESVLAQTYDNWDYTIVNNCSTDRTLNIACAYAKTDNRIHVVSNSAFVGVIENHNNAFRLISQTSKYCKVVSADDWLFPECIQKLVEMAEQNPETGIVGSYAVSNKQIRWIGLPVDQSVFTGPEVCRLYLRGAIDAFGTPSTVLYCSDLVRAHDPFYPGTLPNADLAACLRFLEHTGFAFVHQILSYERIHDQAINATLCGFNAFLFDRFEFLKEYGSTYLTSQEMQSRANELLPQLYENIAVAAVNLRHSELKYYRRRLAQLGYSMYSTGIAGAVSLKLADTLFNPKQTFDKLIRRQKSK